MGARVFRPDGSLAEQFTLVGPAKSERKLAVSAGGSATLPSGVWKLQVRCFRTLTFSFEGLPRFVALSPERAFAIDEKDLPPR